MRLAQKPLFKGVLISSMLFVLAGLAGCGAGFETRSITGPIAGKAISGHVHGGAFPIEQAKVTLMETQSTGYNQPAKVLEQVTSDKNGYFYFDDNWVCDAGQYAYVVISSGHTVASTTQMNNNVIEVGVVGSCSQDMSNGAADSVNVFLSELSTVAAAYTLGNFISISTDPTYGLLANITAPPANNAATGSCSSTNGVMTCTQAGLAHGLQNAINLVDSVRYDYSFPSGTARTSIPGNSQTVVPQALIDTLGNILQACVDSSGVNPAGTNTSTSNDGTQCGQLFEYATPQNGPTPTNTLQVAMNMAKYPNNNVTQLFNMQPSQVFFSPTLSSSTISNTGATMSLSIAIFYEGTGITGDNGLGTPVHVALDANDNAYVVYTSSNSNGAYTAIDGLSSGGTGLFAGAPQTGITSPNEIALDGKGFAWVTDDSASGGLNQIPVAGGSAGTVQTLYSVPNGYAGGVALDASNNVWVSRDAADGQQSIFQFPAAKNYQLPPNGCFITLLSIFGQPINLQLCLSSQPVLNANTKRLYVDSKQNIFGVTNSSSSNAQFYQFPFGSNNRNTVLSSTPLQSTNGFGIAMTSTDEAYLPLNGQLDSANGYTNNTFSTNGNSQGWNAKASGTGATYANPGDTVIDGAGNIYWTDFESTGRLFQMVPITGGNVTNGTLSSIYPCFPLNNQCFGTSSNMRGMAIDSSGAIWYVTDSSPGIAVQTFGLAGNSWPLLSYAHAGVPVQ